MSKWRAKGSGRRHWISLPNHTRFASICGAYTAAFWPANREDATFEGRDVNLKHATKLTRTYAAQMEALNKYRGKGQQKMTVEHVHVHDGGQAIVGPVSRDGGKGGGGEVKKEPSSP